MSRKITTYEELLNEKQKLEVLLSAQKELVKFEINDLKVVLEPAFNALDFLKNLTLRNTHNPIIQAGINMLIDVISNKTKGKDPGFIRSTAIPFILKNYTSNFLEGHADHIIQELVALFSSEDEPVEEE